MQCEETKRIYVGRRDRRDAGRQQQDKHFLEIYTHLGDLVSSRPGTRPRLSRLMSIRLMWLIPQVGQD